MKNVFAISILLVSIGPLSTQSYASPTSKVLSPTAVAPFEIRDVNIGNPAWGLNLLRVHVKNTTAEPHYLKVHIGAGKRRGSGSVGFGMGERYKIAANDDRWLEHWYWLPPNHGKIDAIVKFTEVNAEETDTVQEPFLTKEYEINFAIPNSLCNNLTITEKLPQFKKFYKDVSHLEPFKYFTTKHFVIYCSPDTPAYANIKKLMVEYEAALEKVCEFSGTTPADKIIIFFYPDQATKQMCTMHTGNGLTRGQMIAEVYNDEVKLDPCHELTHVVMGQIGSPPAMFNEGFATYMQTGHIWKGKHIDKTAADLLKNGKLVPLTEMIDRVEIGAKPDDGQVAYPESASFVKFLIDNYPKDCFLDAYKKLKNGDREKNALIIQEIFAVSLSDLEKGWHAILTKTTRPIGRK